MNKQQQLDDIQAKIIKDKVCEDLAKQATQLVFGDGNPDADLVFIGEAPGKNEDLQGKPFVGAAGKFLNEMLEMIGLKRDDVYITNIVKYRPPNNRDPFPDEKIAFLPYLQEQLAVIKSKLIVTLGRHSMDVLLPGWKISQVHGQPKRIKVKSLMSKVESRASKSSNSGVGDSQVDAMQGTEEHRSEPYQEYGEREADSVTQQSTARAGRVVSSARKQAGSVWVILPLFHPAAALYNGAMRQTLIEDFAKIPAILELIET